MNRDVSRALYLSRDWGRAGTGWLCIQDGKFSLTLAAAIPMDLLGQNEMLNIGCNLGRKVDDLARPIPLLSRLHHPQPNHPAKCLCNLLLNTSRDGDSMTSLGSLFKCLNSPVSQQVPADDESGQALEQAGNRSYGSALGVSWSANRHSIINVYINEFII